MQHFTSPLHRKEQCPRAQAGHGVQPKLEAGHDAELTATAAQGPEQIRLMIMIDDSRGAVRTDDLNSQHIIDGEPSRARQPADAARKEEAGDSDVWRRTGLNRKAVLGRGCCDGLPLRARCGPNGALG
jgi:hypothetical protein